jgi:methyltransferase-like protein
MQQNIAQLKLQLIHQIMNIQNIYFLEKLAKILPSEQEEGDILQKLSRPMPKTIDIEQLKKEQNFTSFNRLKMNELRAEINLKEPIDSLIEML